MAGYYTHIERRTRRNPYFREVLFTGPFSQLVVMSLEPGEEIGLETHTSTDQFIRVEHAPARRLLTGKNTIWKKGRQWSSRPGRSTT